MIDKMTNCTADDGEEWWYDLWGLYGWDGANRFERADEFELDWHFLNVQFVALIHAILLEDTDRSTESYLRTHRLKK